jgi:hypothetical protein
VDWRERWDKNGGSPPNSARSPPTTEVSGRHD